MRRAIPAVAAAALLCTACLPVPFDLTLSQGAATAAKMTRDNASTIGSSGGFDSSGSGFAFYPTVLAGGGFDYSAGIATSMSDLQVSFRGIAGGAQYSQQSQSLSNPDSHAPPYIAWPLKSGPTYLFSITFDALNPSASQYVLYQGNPAGGTMNTVPGTLQSLTGGWTVVGASFAEMDGLSYAYDFVHLLGTDGTGNFTENGWQVQSTGLPVQTTPRGGLNPLPFLPTTATRIQYFYDENQPGDPARAYNRSFGSWVDPASGSWKAYAWWQEPTGSGPIYSKPLPVDHRIDALLSTGQLLSTEGDTGRLYDRDGNLLATFPLGNLVFIGEQFVGGVARSYFSQCLIYDHTLHFNVYWIASSQLATLGS